MSDGRMRTNNDGMQAILLVSAVHITQRSVRKHLLLGNACGCTVYVAFRSICSGSCVRNVRIGCRFVFRARNKRSDKFIEGACACVFNRPRDL